MRITLEALNILDAIDRRGSFAAAAEELHRVPSAITYTVQKLEQDLDVMIFDRSGHRAKLTEAGRKLLVEGRYLLEAAGSLENIVKRMATGWEAELRIAVDDLLPMDPLLPLIERFYQEVQGTRIRLSREVFGGTWDALSDDRADIVIGAAGDPPEEGTYSTLPMGHIRFVFAVAPDHPLAGAEEPVAEERRREFRAVAVADSSRRLAPRSAGILSGQDVLTVPDMLSKCEMQRRGIGVGQVPHYMVAQDIQAGRLVLKETESESIPAPLKIAWRTRQEGNALQWFIDHLRRETPFQEIVESD